MSSKKIRGAEKQEYTACIEGEKNNPLKPNQSRDNVNDTISR